MDVDELFEVDDSIDPRNPHAIFKIDRSTVVSFVKVEILPSLWRVFVRRIFSFIIIRLPSELLFSMLFQSFELGFHLFNFVLFIADRFLKLL